MSAVQRTDDIPGQRGSTMPRKMVQTHLVLSNVSLDPLIKISTPLMLLTLYNSDQFVKYCALQVNIWEEYNRKGIIVPIL